MTTLPEPTIRPTRYEVSLLPEGDINYPIYVLGVEARGNDKWAVVRHGWCLGVDGHWSYESVPSERADDWLINHRFPLHEAFWRAKAAAPDVSVNGQTAVDAYRRTHAEAQR